MHVIRRWCSVPWRNANDPLSPAQDEKLGIHGLSALVVGLAGDGESTDSRADLPRHQYDRRRDHPHGARV